MKARYVNPYTDFGFKKLFGEEANKELLRDFLNNLLSEEYQIAELSLKTTEVLAESSADRKAIFDIYCESQHGDKFIVEMQKAKIQFFKERTVFYTTFPIREQAERGDWDFKLKPVFCIAILDFVFDEEKRPDNAAYLNKIQLRDEYCNVFYDKLTYIFIEMPRFNKTEAQLQTRMDKWLYFLKHLEDFNTIPQILNEPIFRRGFEVAEIANFNEQQRDAYEGSLKTYRDLKAIVDTAFGDGETKGKLEGKLQGKLEGKLEVKFEIALMMKNEGETVEKIMKFTGLSQEEIEQL